EDHDDDECDDPDCECHHHHDDEDEHEHHHHHHHHDHDDDDDDDDECDDPNCACHHHHDDHDDDEDEHEHHPHHHHHHHHADEVFVSWGRETTKKFSKEELEGILEALLDEHTYGAVLRAKGIVESTDGSWIHFDYVPGEPDIRSGSAGIIGRLCVIGSKLDEEALEKLFDI
ncbi:MAG: cobalamin biosynthesis protein CobW, partial [Clostridia bacterium]|nr:cobalamin biosynthesis protein CobW [Clostridia bacterium]